MTLCVMSSWLWLLRRGAANKYHNIYFCGNTRKIPGPSCSKLTMSLVNDSLKFTSSDTQIC